MASYSTEVSGICDIIDYKRYEYHIHHGGGVQVRQQQNIFTFRISKAMQVQKMFWIYLAICEYAFALIGKLKLTPPENQTNVQIKLAILFP